MVSNERERERADVVVVGAGPVGAYAAYFIAAQGRRVIILEEHQQIGEPIQCAGLLTPRVLDLLPNADEVAKKVVESEIYGANMYTMDGFKLPIMGNRLEALAINRTLFDQCVADLAAEHGAEVRKGARAVAAQRENGVIVVDVELRKPRSKTVKTMQIETSLLIGADGFNSHVAKWFDFPKPAESIFGFEAEMSGLHIEDSVVEMFVGAHFSPGLFAWVIPSGNGNGRVGLCVSRPANPRTYFDALLKHPVARHIFDGATVTRYFGGCIPLGVLERTYADNVMLVGDAAAQVKPTSAGGVYTGMICAKHCADAALAALDANDYSAAMLRTYQKNWEHELGRELKTGMLLRKAYLGMDDAQLAEIFRKLSDEKTLAIIAEYGDIDFPSRVARKLLPKAPSFLKYAPAVARALLK